MEKVKLFWSYCHADMQPIGTWKTNWLPELEDHIEAKLGTRLGGSGRSPYVILRDRRGMIVAGDRIHDKVEDGIRDCDIAIAFVSREYVRSKSCAEELRQITDLGKPLIVVEMTKGWKESRESVIDEAVVQKVADDLVIVFWEATEDGDRLVGEPIPGVDKEQYRTFSSIVQKLFHSIECQKSRILARREQSAESAAKKQAAQRHDLFLATATRDVSPLTDRLLRQLQEPDYGFSVVHMDLADPALTEGMSVESLVETMKSCNHFVQVVGAVPGKSDVLGSGKNLLEVQHDAAVAAGLDCHLWLSPDVDPEECGERHRSFIQTVGCQVATYEEFVVCLVKHLNEARELAAIQKELENRGKGRVVAIDFDPSDRDKYDALSDALIERRVAIAQAIMDEPKLSEMKNATNANNGILIVYGGSRGAQKRAESHFQIFWKLSETTKENYCKLAIGDAAPATAPPCPRGPGVKMISVRDGVDRQAVEDFVNSLPEPTQVAEPGA